MSNQRDKYIIEGFKSRKEDVIGEFYHELKDTAYGMMTKFNVPKEKIQELYHDSILQCIDNVNSGKFKSKASLNTYCLSILKYKCLSSFKNKVNTSELNESIEFKLLEEEYNLESEPDDLPNLNIALGQLSKECSQLLLDYYYGQLKLKELASKYEYSEGFIRIKKMRCLKKLKSLMNG